MAVSAKTIAKELGLSQSTVSLALRNLPGISDETREKVLRKAVEMGYKKPVYQPNDQPHYISLVLYKKHGNVLADTPFFSDLIQGIELEAKKCGYQVFITYFYENQDIKEQIDSLKKSLCSGVILIATEMRSTDMAPFQSLQMPIVILDRYFPEYDYDCLVINNIHGAKRAVQHLIDKGHTNIGYLSSSIEIRNFRERREGFFKGIRLLDKKKASEPIIVKVSPVVEQAEADMDKYLASKPALPTAFFADNDNIASACMRSFIKAGYRIPEDISIIGFDDMPFCRVLTPSLSTMSVNKTQLGALSVDFLIRRMEGSDDFPVTIQVSPRLIERDSVKKL